MFNKEKLILEKYSDADLVETFISEYHSNPTNTSVSRFINRKGRLCIKDWNGSFYGDWLGVAGHHYGITASGSLNREELERVIDLVYDDLIVKQKKVLKSSYTPLERIKLEPTVISILEREFEQRDIDYWSQFGINLELLNVFNVKIADTVSINNHSFYRKGTEDPCYAYWFSEGYYKIYRPLVSNANYKWRTNYSGIDGKEDSKPKILAKSRKDRMVLSVLLDKLNLDYSTYCYNNEAFVPTKLLDSTTHVFYDNDYKSSINVGQIYAGLIVNKFKVNNLVIPEKYKAKDISDFRKKHGEEAALNWLEESLLSQ
jgi:hypothetical protein